MEQKKAQELAVTAARARLLAMDMVHRAASGHIGGSLSAMDILTVLYFDVMRVDPARPDDPERDRFVLSKGPVSYTHLTPEGRKWFQAWPTTPFDRCGFFAAWPPP